jgi:hypothetical protein
MIEENSTYDSRGIIAMKKKKGTHKKMMSSPFKLP